MRRFIKRIAYRLAGVRDQLHPPTQEHLFDVFFSMVNPDNFFFVQIGACDGILKDPLYPYVTKYNLAGIALEPMPREFQALQRNYKNYPRVQCVNTAIGKEAGTLPFYTVTDAFKKDPSSLSSISSFDRNTLKKNITGSKERDISNVNAEDYIQEVSVKTLHFDDLVRMYNIKRIDFLQIDCEGYDYEILKTFDFNRFSPKIINFESVHLSGKDRRECEQMLTSKGYTFFYSRNDTCAYKIL